MSISASNPDRTDLLHRGLLLERVTIVWNVIEAVIAIGAGLAAGSIALVGFGLDSIIEVIAASALYVRLRHEAQGRGDSHKAERRALRIVAITFFLLALYVGYEAVSNLLAREPPGESMVGIVLSALSLVVMPALAVAKLRTGRALGSKALIADSKETFACAYLSATLLAGLVLNAALSWWWADPVAALAMIPFILKEGWEAFDESREEDEEAAPRG